MSRLKVDTWRKSGFETTAVAEPGLPLRFSSLGRDTTRIFCTLVDRLATETTWPNPHAFFRTHRRSSFLPV
jgi:hypothetical protein